MLGGYVRSTGRCPRTASRIGKEPASQHPPLLSRSHRAPGPDNLTAARKGFRCEGSICGYPAGNNLDFFGPGLPYLDLSITGIGLEESQFARVKPRLITRGRRSDDRAGSGRTQPAAGRCGRRFRPSFLPCAPQTSRADNEAKISPRFASVSSNPWPGLYQQPKPAPQWPESRGRMGIEQRQQPDLAPPRCNKYQATSSMMIRPPRLAPISR